jgi:hypothetical protein
MKAFICDIVHHEVEIPAVCPQCGADFSKEEEANIRALPVELGSSLRGSAAIMDGATYISFDTVSADGANGILGYHAYRCAACDHTLARGQLQSS